MQPYQEHFVGNKKIHVIDNAMPDDVVDRWISYYENSASFRMTSTENSNDPESDHWMCGLVDLKTRFQVFDIESWLIPLIQRFNPDCSIKDFMRSYINMCTVGDKAKGHADTDDNFNSPDQFFTASLVFLNPHVQDPADSGFEFEDGYYVENVFNRLVIFDGRIWHKPHVPSDNLVRLTLYNSFKKPRNIYDYSKTQAVWLK